VGDFGASACRCKQGYLRQAARSGAGQRAGGQASCARAEGLLGFLSASPAAGVIAILAITGAVLVLAMGLVAHKAIGSRESMRKYLIHPKELVVATLVDHSRHVRRASTVAVPPALLKSLQGDSVVPPRVAGLQSGNRRSARAGVSAVHLLSQVAVDMKERSPVTATTVEFKGARVSLVPLATALQHRGDGIRAARSDARGAPTPTARAATTPRWFPHSIVVGCCVPNSKSSEQ
jgi:hypothetical protein